MSQNAKAKNLDSLLKDLGGIAETLALGPREVLGLHRKYVNPILPWVLRFVGMNIRVVKASGARLTDEQGRTYLDFLSGFGSLNLGHEPPEVLAAMQAVEGQPNFLQSYLNPFAGKLAEYLAKITPGHLSRSFFCNSGSEAVEAAIKLARAATGKRILLYAQGAFHGKTLGALSVSGREKYKKPFEPLLPDTVSVPYDDLEALEDQLKRQSAAAFIVEPIQGEAGVIVPKKGYLKRAEALCRRYQALLIVDEIQTGMGRTGRLFCCEHEGVEPDVLVLSKSLGGGVMPIGAMVTTDSLWRKAYGSLENFLLHSSTFGGNTRACAAGIAAIRLLLEKDWIKNAALMGEEILSKLSALQARFPLLKAVRGRGLMIGLSFARIKGKSPLAEGALTLYITRQLLRKHRILTAFTLNNYDVLRIAPPLFISREDARYFLESLEDVLGAAQKLFRFHPVEKAVR